MVKVHRLPFILLAVVGLLAGLLTGLSRIGWQIETLGTSNHHGSIMVGGFLGTLISLEKIIPLKKRMLFLIPLLSASSVFLFFAGATTSSFLLLVLASALFTGVLIYYFVLQKNESYLLMLAGGLCWLVGNIILISKTFYPLAFPWWLGFALFIITAERVELMKFLPVSRQKKFILGTLLLIYIFGVLVSFHSGGNLISGLALIGVSIWLLRHDVIGISMRKTGLPRFVATALMSGYVGLLMTGICFITLGGQPLSYDTIVHTFFLGFVFSMIFAHGSIILPGVLGISAKPYHAILYLWLFVLHGSWILRAAADISLDLQLRRLAGMASALCILAYFASMVILTAYSQRRHAKVF